MTMLRTPELLKTSTGRLRVALGVIGIALIAYGGLRILGNSKHTNPMGLAKWLIGAAVIHDGIFVPIVSVLGFGLSHVMKPRARRFVQFAFIVGGSLTLIALPEIDRRGTQAASKAWLMQDYKTHLYLLLTIVVAVTLLGYLATVIRDARAMHKKERPESSNSSST